ncbi:hypothetical protein A2U01_0094310, partial [Trifolium medium]|nr:hypothetical protein [Trifolium medium]
FDEVMSGSGGERFVEVEDGGIDGSVVKNGSEALKVEVGGRRSNLLLL